MNLYPKFAALLREARIRARLRQPALARRLRVTTRYVRSLEAGAALPSMELFARMWQLLRFDGNAAMASLELRALAIPEYLRRGQPVLRVTGTDERYASSARLLTRARWRARLTQEAVAYAVRCSTRCLTRIEQGHRVPSVRILARIRDCIGVDVNALLEAMSEDLPREPFYSFGLVLLDAREQVGMAPVDVARATRCPVRVYANAERGAELPTVLMLARLHGVLRFDGDAALRAVPLADEDAA